MPIGRHAILQVGRTEEGATQTAGAVLETVARAVGGGRRTLTEDRMTTRHVHSAEGASLSSQSKHIPCTEIALPGTHSTSSSHRAALLASPQVAAKLCSLLVRWAPG